MLILYSTEGCHLCEMAFALVDQVGLAEQTDIIDIAFDDVLFSRYGVTIPVLKYQDSELSWPFDLEQLIHWLDNNGITYHS
ncbi:TPA: glutaredoxin family protein [Vibrio alginolyticus]|uniref:glutaredoxin family protein n=1 Tax=Vibrio TaxID=662 RepID=UPI001BD5387C|nr:glutaredoxin family protein [Vibrio sp. Vb0598]EHK9546987.1 glutaredoxin family protein [Vibrio alginolyticus]EHK9602440.1 glutaredoxin family protein [Vibrio alginolyticus]EII3281029.1 glutaredoxin family protein [Vibrio alginolyticus]MBS9948589.1 glutaredoxin family protein [Vibrio alginolyticus]MBS9956225.1 glutaredoxin family protein [Vibrio alginolyticus]